jgi:hypothetical protein
MLPLCAFERQQPTRDNVGFWEQRWLWGSSFVLTPEVAITGIIDYRSCGGAKFSAHWQWRHVCVLIERVLTVPLKWAAHVPPVIRDLSNLSLSLHQPIFARSAACWGHELMTLEFTWWPHSEEKKTFHWVSSVHEPQRKTRSTGTKQWSKKLRWEWGKYSEMKWWHKRIWPSWL